jgi:phosphoribosyl 1,2-cyclic phosphodiesterase
MSVRIFLLPGKPMNVVEPHTSKETAPCADEMAICVLASGSKGNSTFISNGPSGILFDAGLSGVEIERRLQSRGLSTESLKAIVVSHEHSDHVHGVGVLSRRYGLPVYINRKTAGAATHLGKVHQKYYFECGVEFKIGNLTIHPFSLSHDAADPAGFTVRRNGIKIGLATDLGIATNMVTEHLKNCRALILEANHDPQMLIDGPYPWTLKQRIQSRMGHLSNLDSTSLLSKIVHQKLEHVILAHLSETNNTPDKALNSFTPVLSDFRTHLAVAIQDRCTDIIYLR